MTIEELARRIDYYPSPSQPESFLDWYRNFRGDLLREELMSLTGDSPVEDEVAESIIAQSLLSLLD